jgi:hypothetical protein
MSLVHNFLWVFPVQVSALTHIHIIISSFSSSCCWFSVGCHSKLMWRIRDTVQHEKLILFAIRWRACVTFLRTEVCVYVCVMSINLVSISLSMCCNMTIHSHKGIRLAQLCQAKQCIIGCVVCSRFFSRFPLPSSTFYVILHTWFFEQMKCGWK